MSTTLEERPVFPSGDAHINCKSVFRISIQWALRYGLDYSDLVLRDKKELSYIVLEYSRF